MTLHTSWPMVGRFLLWLILCQLIINAPVHSEGTEAIRYIGEDDTSVSAILAPDPAPGVVPTSKNNLVTFSIDGKPIAVSLKGSGQGKAAVATQLSSLSEGRHTATLRTLKPDRSNKDSKQLLFIYDTIPPEMTLISPESLSISKYNSSFIVEIADEGSGFPALRQDMEVTASVNSVEAHVASVAKRNKRYLIIDDLGSQYTTDSNEYNLNVTLKDRAGNEAALTKNFITPDFYTEFHYTEEVCPTSKSHYNLVHTFANRKDYTFPISALYRTLVLQKPGQTSTLTIWAKIGEDLPSQVMNAISLESDHPALAVKRISTTGSSTTFAVTQIASVNTYETLTFLRVEFPRFLYKNYKGECTKNSGNLEISFDHFSVSAERDSFNIPVQMSGEHIYYTEVNSGPDPDGSFYIDYLTWTDSDHAPLDIVASYLSLGSDNYFFNPFGEKLRARIPIEKEGSYTIEATLACNLCVWSDDAKGTDLKHETFEMLVNMGSPQIKSFHYNETDEMLEAVFTDIGTPLDELRLELSVSRFGSRDFTLQKTASGDIRLTSPFPEPPAIFEASLVITDLVNNRTRATCKIYGVPPEPSHPEDPENRVVTDYHLKAKTPEEDRPFLLNQPNASPNGSKVLSDRTDGLSVYRNCLKGLIVADGFVSPQTGFAKIAPGEDSRKHTDSLKATYQRDSFWGTTFYTALVWNEEQRSYRNKMFYQDSRTWSPYTSVRKTWNYSFETCENEIRDTRPPKITNITFDPVQGTLTATIGDHGMPASHIQTEVFVFIGVPGPDSRTCRHLHDHTFTPDPSPSITPDVYQNSPGEAEHNSKNTILSTLEIDSQPATTAQKVNFAPVIGPYLTFLREHTDSLRTKEKRQAGRPGHGLSGRLEAKLDLPPLQHSEVFHIVISATDRSGNKGFETLSLTIPREPPHVSLELVKKGDSASFASINGTSVNTHLLARAFDESALDLSPDRTFVRVDSHKLAPISQHGSGWVPYDPDRPDTYSFDNFYGYNPGHGQSNSDGYIGHYGAMLEEGQHSALFRATDAVGLFAEASLDFSIQYPPQIFDFQVKSKAIQEMGGPAFTAMIIDRGNDLEHGDIDFYIDSTAVAADKLYYDPPSGYFSVSGPLGIADGYHTATVTATDRAGHQASETLRFGIAEELMPYGDEAGLDLKRLNIWEIDNQNNDGYANPGETVRLFPTLYNHSFQSLDQCTGILTAADTRITVETGSRKLAPLAARTTTTLLSGFDVRIGEDMLETTVSDPYLTHLRLNVACGEDQWELPFTLPIYRPTVPTDINSTVTITLEPTPRTTTEAEFNLRGKALSSASSMQELVIRVNGDEIKPRWFDSRSGEFETPVPVRHGANLIEIEAYDRSGAVGYKSVFINCTSELTVTIDRLPAVTTEQEVKITGTATSSASVVDRVVMSINGADIPLRWDRDRGRFETRIPLAAGQNLILVEAWDEAGAYGRDTARLTLQSDITVVLDNLPQSTNDAAITVAGKVQGTTPIDRVVLRVNGSQRDANYNQSTRRFSAPIDLEVGGNGIVAIAFGTGGGQGQDRAFVTRTTVFVPPSISLTWISEPNCINSTYCCSASVEGTYNTGSSSLDSLDVSFDGDGSRCTVSTGSNNTFSAECDIQANDDLYDIVAEIINQDGATATDVISIPVIACQ
jgi:hypothetical protein